MLPPSRALVVFFTDPAGYGRRSPMLSRYQPRKSKQVSTPSGTTAIDSALVLHKESVDEGEDASIDISRIIGIARTIRATTIEPW